MNILVKATSAITFALGAFLIATPGQAAELVMVERPGCYYCIAWKREIGGIYPKTKAGEFAPLNVVDIKEAAPFEGGYQQPIVYTPTFVIVENGQEVGRILGYQGEDFFWPTLEKLLEDTTEFQLAAGS